VSSNTRTAAAVTQTSRRNCTESQTVTNFSRRNFAFSPTRFEYE